MGFFSNIKKIAGVEQTPATYPQQTEPQGYQAPTTPFDAEYAQRANGPMELRMVSPSAFSEVPAIAKDLMDHRTVVLNMENTAPDVMRRLLDFLSGVAFCIGGQLQQIGSRTYIITPPSIDVTGEQFDLGGQAAAPQPQSAPGTAPQNGAYPNFDPFRMQ